MYAMSARLVKAKLLAKFFRKKADINGKADISFDIQVQLNEHKIHNKNT